MLKCTKHIEDDGSITLSLQDFDIVVNEDTTEKAMKSVVNNLKEYIEEYFNNIEYWSTDKERNLQIYNLCSLINYKFIITPKENSKNIKEGEMVYDSNNDIGRI